MSQIDIIKENIQYEQLLKEVSSNNVLKSEHLIRDSHPDVHEILGVDAKATVTNKEILADKVMIEGQITYSILYISEDESKTQRVNSVNLTEKFADYLDLNNEEHKILCDVECIIEHIEADIMNERKISIDGIRSTKWNVYKIGEFEFVKDIEGKEDVQIQRKHEELNKMKGKKEIELLGKSMMKVTMDKPEIEEVLKCSINLHKKEMKIGENKIYFGCYCKVEVLYKGRGLEELILLQDDVYLSREEELVGISSDMLGSHDIDISNYDYTIVPDDLGENRVITVEFLAKGTAKVTSKEKVEVVKDAYSPTVNMELVKKNHELGLVHGNMTTNIILKDNLYLKDEKQKAASILLAYGLPIVTDKKVDDDKIKIEGVIKASVLYKTAEDEGKLFMCHGEVPFTAVIDIKGTKSHMHAVSKVNLESLDATIEANTIAIRATVSVCAKVMYKVSKEWITDVIQGSDEKKEKKCSVTIYVVNKDDTLWELAKKFNTTVDELVKINDLDNTENLAAGERIIIPGRAIF